MHGGSLESWGSGVCRFLGLCVVGGRSFSGSGRIFLEGFGGALELNRKRWWRFDLSVQARATGLSAQPGLRLL
jgi:hypothetical protein